MYEFEGDYLAGLQVSGEFYGAEGTGAQGDGGVFGAFYEFVFELLQH